MTTLRVVGRAVLFAGLVLRCSAPATGSVSISATPSRIDDQGGMTTVTADALNADGTPGKGAIRIVSSAGSLKDGETPTLVDGQAQVSFSCSVAQDPGCMGSVRVVAIWTVNGQDLGADVRIPVGNGMTGAGGGGTGGGGAPSTDECVTADAGFLDTVSMHGSIAGRGNIDVVITGGSGGDIGAGSFALFTDVFQLVGTPENVYELSLLVSPRNDPFVLGRTYPASNDQSGNDPILGVGIQFKDDDGGMSGVVCGDGFGVGSFRFDSAYGVATDGGTSGTLGVYTFSCSQPIMHVNGCFYYRE